jgi:hypothetical protein
LTNPRPLNSLGIKQLDAGGAVPVPSNATDVGDTA